MVASGPGRGSGTSAGWPTPGCGGDGGAAVALAVEVRGWSSLLAPKLIGGTCDAAAGAGGGVSALSAGAGGGGTLVAAAFGAGGRGVGPGGWVKLCWRPPPAPASRSRSAVSARTSSARRFSFSSGTIARLASKLFGWATRSTGAVRKVAIATLARAVPTSVRPANTVAPTATTAPNPQTVKRNSGRISI